MFIIKIYNYQMHRLYSYRAGYKFFCDGYVYISGSRYNIYFINGFGSISHSRNRPSAASFKNNICSRSVCGG